MSRILEWNWSPMALACWIGCASWLYVWRKRRWANIMTQYLMKSWPRKGNTCTSVLCGQSNYCLYILITREAFVLYISALQAQICVWGRSYRFITPVLQYIQLPSDHRLHGDRANLLKNCLDTTEEANQNLITEVNLYLKLELNFRKLSLTLNSVTKSCLRLMHFNHCSSC